MKTENPEHTSQLSCSSTFLKVSYSRSSAYPSLVHKGILTYPLFIHLVSSVFAHTSGFIFLCFFNEDLAWASSRKLHTPYSLYRLGRERNLVTLVSCRDFLKLVNCSLPELNELPGRKECFTSPQTSCCLTSLKTSFLKIVYYFTYHFIFYVWHSFPPKCKVSVSDGSVT